MSQSLLRTSDGKLSESDLVTETTMVTQDMSPTLGTGKGESDVYSMPFELKVKLIKLMLVTSKEGWTRNIGSDMSSDMDIYLGMISGK